MRPWPSALALAVYLVGLELPADRPVRLWVADEMRYGLRPVTRRVWSLPGVRPVCPVNPRYEWAYVYGAAEVGGEARVEFCYSSTVDLQHSRLFLQQIGAREPGATPVVIWDGAGFHPQDGAAGLPDNVRLGPLPAYSPELNPLEGLWDQLKDHLCHKGFASLRAVQKAMTNFPATLLAKPRAGARLDRGRLVTGTSPGLFPPDLYLFDWINGIRGAGEPASLLRPFRP